MGSVPAPRVLQVNTHPRVVVVWRPDDNSGEAAPAEVNFTEPSKYAGLRVMTVRASLWKGPLSPEHIPMPKLHIAHLPGDPIEGTWVLEHVVVTAPGTPVSLEQRWDKERGVVRSISAPAEPMKRTQWNEHMATGWHMTQLMGWLESRAGRPEESLSLEQVQAVCRHYREQNSGKAPSQDQLREVLCQQHGVCVGERQFKQKIADLRSRTGMTWTEIKTG